MGDKVSVVVPMYNSEKTILRCLESIQKQTYTDTEIIVINDGSTDESLTIVSEYIKEKKGQYRLISQHNSGVSSARNVGIRAASGAFVMFVDSDDYLDINAIQHMVDLQIKTRAQLVIANHVRHEKENTIFFDSLLPENLAQDMAITALFEKKIRVGCCGKLYSLPWIKEHDLYFPEDRYGEDMYHLFFMIMSGCRMAWLNEPIYHVVDTSGSICNSYSFKFIYMLDTLDRIKEELIKTGYWKNHKNDFKKYYLSQLKFLLNYGIRFDQNDFVNSVLRKNIYPKGSAGIELRKGIKITMDDMLFCLDKRLYVKIKMARRRMRLNKTAI